MPYKNPEDKKRHAREYTAAHKNDPAFRAKAAKRQRAYHKRNRKKRNLISKAYKKTPKYKAYQKKYQSTEEYKAYKRDLYRRNQDLKKELDLVLSELPKAAREKFMKSERARVQAEKQRKIETRKLEILQKKEVLLVNKEIELWKLKINKAILRLKIFKQSRKERLSEIRIVPMHIIGDKLRRYRDAANDYEEEKRRAFGVLEVA